MPVGGFLTFYGTNITLTNSTVSGNSTAGSLSDGGGIVIGDYQENTLTLNNSTITQNTASHVSSYGDGPSEITGTNTDNVFNNNPGLIALADNGCAAPAGSPATAACVQTHALLATSVALDAGVDNVLSTDQRGIGFPRTINGLTDIAAFENPVSVPAAVIPTLSQWATAGLALLMLVGGLFGRRRKQG